MNEIILEQRVSEVERNLNLLSKKMTQYGEESHEKLTRLEDWLIQYSITNQKNIEESQRWRQEMEESRREHEQEMKAFRQSLAKSEQRMADSKKEIAQSMADNKKEVTQSMANSKKEMEQSMADSKKEIAQDFKSLDKKIADSRKELGQISHRLGTVVEDLVAPSLPRVLQEIVKCPNEDVIINVRVRRRHPTQRGQMLEIDAIADCGSYVLVNETKSQFSPEKVKAFLEKLSKIREYFPEYQSHQIIGSIASLYLDNSLIEYASRRGLLALASGEYLMTIQNLAGFDWKTF